MVNVVYFNQWFSSIANVIDDLKRKHGDNIKLIASSKNKEHVYKYSVDKFIYEDWESVDDDIISMKNYVDFVLKLCKQYRVDVFFVKKHAKYIMARHEEFEKLGVHLISEDYIKLQNMDKKSYVYKLLKLAGMANIIPEYHVFNDAKHVYNLLNKEKGTNKFCVKYDSDEGGTSFRHIDDTPVSINSFNHFRINKITTDEIVKLCLDDYSAVNKFMFMEMLDSPEISIDCYNSKKGFVALCRIKEGGRVQRLFINDALSSLCEDIGDKLELKFPYNVQFRVKNGTDWRDFSNLRLLEVNPRMSGGLYYEVENGLNIAELCLLDVLDRENEYDISKFSNFEDIYMTHVEKAIKLT